MQANMTSGQVFILLKDKEQAEKATRVLGMSVPRQLHTSTCQVLKGELVAPIPPGDILPRSDGQPPHNYHTLTKESPATFYEDARDQNLAPLTPNEYDVLVGVKASLARYRIFVNDLLDWGIGLKVGDKVLVEVPLNEGASPSEICPKVYAEIKYVGPVKTLPGITFGVEIKDKNYFGWGTSHGKFQHEMYFICKKDNGLFVSLEKLFPYDPLKSCQQPPSAHPSSPKPWPTPRDRGQQGHSEPQISHRYKVGDHVVAFTKKEDPVHGIVKWVGMHSYKKQALKAVGIELNVKLRSNEIETLPNKSHLVVASKDKSVIFLAEDEVISEVTFAEKPPAEPPIPEQSVDAAVLHEAFHDEERSVGETAALARAMGVKQTELLRQDQEARMNIKQKKQQEIHEDIRRAVPDESLNISGQEKILEQISQERRRVEDRIGGGGGGDGGTSRRGEGEDGWGNRGGERGEKRKGDEPQSRHQPRMGEHTYATVGRESEGVTLPPHHHHQPGQIWHQATVVPDQVLSANNIQPYGHNGYGVSRPPDNPQPIPYSQGSTAISQQAGFSNSPQAVPPRSQPPVQHNVAYTDQQVSATGLMVGSVVQINNNESRTGTIKWIGMFPSVKGAIAGVELDEPMEGCGDGEWNGYRAFTCRGGHGFFCPLNGLIPAKLTNPLKNIPGWEDTDQTVAGDQFKKYIGDAKGIQGHQNSCYLDATIFGLFALSDVFDLLFLDHFKTLTNVQSPVTETPATVVQREVGAMLWKGIVNPLRKNGAVRFESVMRLRNKLEELGKMEGVNTAEKDPEEFLNMLFKHTLHVDEPFIRIKRPFGTEPEFFVQLFVEFDESIKIPTIERLLTKMFKEQQISFAGVPSKLLVQVPRYGKQFQTYKRIIPGIKLDTTPLLDTPNTCFICGESAQMSCSQCNQSEEFKPSEIHFCIPCNNLVHNKNMRVNHKPERNQGKDEAVELELLSVLCIETSHYVCFSRDSEGRWLFFDSMADRLYDQFNIPRGVECTAQLNEWVYEGDQERLMAAGPRELPELVRRFTQDVYMCVYIQPDCGMYG